MAKVAGRNPVYELLNGPRRVHRLMIHYEAEGEIIEKIISRAKKDDIPVERATAREIDDLAELDNHQGVLALAEDIDNKNPETVLQAVRAGGDTPRFLLLDQIQDPQNFGALIRTARAAGFQAVIYPGDRSCPITPAVVKASAGAIEYTAMCQVTNLNRTMEMLKEEAVWLFGTEPEGETLYYEADLTGALGIVIGSEGSGLRRLVRENCDFLLGIPVSKYPGSLNASAAAAVVLYEAVRQSRLNLD